MILSIDASHTSLRASLMASVGPLVIVEMDVQGVKLLSNKGNKPEVVYCKGVVEMVHEVENDDDELPFTQRFGMFCFHICRSW